MGPDSEPSKTQSSHAIASWHTSPEYTSPARDTESSDSKTQHDNDPDTSSDLASFEILLALKQKLQLVGRPHAFPYYVQLLSNDVTTPILVSSIEALEFIPYMTDINWAMAATETTLGLDTESGSINDRTIFFFRQVAKGRRCYAQVFIQAHMSPRHTRQKKKRPAYPPKLSVLGLEGTTSFCIREPSDWGRLFMALLDCEIQHIEDQTRKTGSLVPKMSREMTLELFRRGECEGNGHLAVALECHHRTDLMGCVQFLTGALKLNASINLVFANDLLMLDHMRDWGVTMAPSRDPFALEITIRGERFDVVTPPGQQGRDALAHVFATMLAAYEQEVQYQSAKCSARIRAREDQRKALPKEVVDIIEAQNKKRVEDRRAKMKAKAKSGANLRKKTLKKEWRKNRPLPRTKRSHTDGITKKAHKGPNKQGAAMNKSTHMLLPTAISQSASVADRPISTSPNTKSNSSQGGNNPFVTEIEHAGKSAVPISGLESTIKMHLRYEGTLKKRRPEEKNVAFAIGDALKKVREDRINTIKKLCGQGGGQSIRDCNTDEANVS